LECRLIAAVAVAILNLHRVADLRMPWLAPAIMVLGIGFVALSGDVRDKTCFHRSDASNKSSGREGQGIVCNMIREAMFD
jgi:hypothetical protein